MPAFLLGNPKVTPRPQTWGEPPLAGQHSACKYPDKTCPPCETGAISRAWQPGLPLSPDE